jgi:hypothetical protein
VRLSHPTARARALFDDPHPVSYAGRVPVEALAERAGRGGLAAGHVRPRGDCGAVPARTARGRSTLRLPRAGTAPPEWLALWEAACGPPTPATAALKPRPRPGTRGQAAANAGGRKTRPGNRPPTRNPTPSGARSRPAESVLGR